MEALMDKYAAKLRLKTGNSLLVLLLAISALFSAGCGTIQSSDTGGGINNELVARDLLFVMAQLFEPDTTTFQLGEPSTDFGVELESGFREIGYGMQRVSADHGPNFMTYSEAMNVSSTSERTYKYSVYIGDVGLERHYAEHSEVGVFPAGPMVVYGTKKRVLLSEQLFPGQSLNVSYQDGDDTVIGESAIKVFDTSLVSAISELRGQSLPGYRTFNTQQKDIQNLFSRGSSNFEALGRNYRIVRKEVVAFPDDSLFLLDKGRGQIQNIVKFYRAETDLIRVVGCSNGPTKYEGGNIALAQGRSARIAQELVKRDVDKETILDEGCWSPQSAGERFPARGVIIELQRQS